MAGRISGCITATSRAILATPTMSACCWVRPSGWLIDVDLDHPLAVELADEFLPPTASVFGRVGKPRSHRLYVVTEPIETQQRKCAAGMLVTPSRFQYQVE